MVTNNKQCQEKHFKLCTLNSVMPCQILYIHTCLYKLSKTCCQKNAANFYNPSSNSHPFFKLDIFF